MIKKIFMMLFISYMGLINLKISSTCIRHPLQCCTNNPGENKFGKTYFSARPQDSNTARRLMGEAKKIYVDDNNIVYSSSIEFQKGYRSGDIGTWFFFNGLNTMSYGQECNGSFDVYAINFGTTYSGNMSIEPEITNFITDIDIWLDGSRFICNTWARINLPIVYSQWKINAEDQMLEGGSLRFPPQLVSAGSPLVPFRSLEEAFENDQGFGDAPALKCGLMQPRSEDTKLAGVHLEIGYDIVRTCRGHIGIGPHLVIPTGTRPDSKYLFNAVVGAGKNWELGAVINAHYELWNNPDGDHHFYAFFDSLTLHQFKARQKRLFGLFVDGESSPGSSWLLLKKFDQNGNYESLERAANLLCCNAKFGSNIMFDGSFLLEYDNPKLSLGLGYNFWYRTREHISNLNCSIANNTYAIKGNSLVTNNSTQSNSTINVCAEDETDTARIFISESDIDVCTALHTNAYSNKLFGFISFKAQNCYQPYITFGAEVEVGNDNKAFNQWGIIFKTGMSV